MEAELNRLEKKLTKEVLWLYILSSLKKEPMHAYALRKKIFEKFNFLPGEVSAYVVLYKLQSRGFVSTKKDENKVNYSITQKGEKLFEQAKKNIIEKQKQIFG